MMIYSQQLEHDGFVAVSDVVNGGQCEALADRVQALQNDGAGSRALLDQAWCAEFVNSRAEYGEAYEPWRTSNNDRR